MTLRCRWHGALRDIGTALVSLGLLQRLLQSQNGIYRFGRSEKRRTSQWETVAQSGFGYKKMRFKQKHPRQDSNLRPAR